MQSYRKLQRLWIGINQSKVFCFFFTNQSDAEGKGIKTFPSPFLLHYFISFLFPVASLGASLTPSSDCVPAASNIVDKSAWQGDAAERQMSIPYLKGHNRYFASQKGYLGRKSEVIFELLAFCFDRWCIMAKDERNKCRGAQRKTKAQISVLF